jgi:hypothetical protein
MALKIYTAADPGTALSENGAHTNDFLVALDGKVGGVLQKKLYVRNDDAAYRFTGISLTVASTETGTSYVNNSLGYSWKFSGGATQPLDLEWELVSDGNTITLPNIGAAGLPDTSTYLPFWVRIKIPRDVDVRTFLDLQFLLDSTAILI